MELPGTSLLHRSLLAFLTLGALSACAGSDGTQAGSAAGAETATYSAGVRVVESPPAQAEALLPWEVDAVPFLRIGEEDGDPALLFTSIMSVAAQDGTIAVADQRTRDLRLFSMDGAPLGRVQQVDPSGPAGLGFPRVFPDSASGGLLLVDAIGSVGGFVDGTGRVDRVFRWGVGGTSLQRSQAVAWTGRTLVLLASAEEGGSQAQRSGGMTEQRTSWGHISPGDSVPQPWDRETRVPIHYVPQGGQSAAGASRMIGMPTPLAQSPHLTARNGRVFKTTRNGTELLLLDEGGQGVARYRIGGGEHPVAAADVEREARAFATRAMSSESDVEAYVQQALAVPWAEVLPRFSTLLAGPDGEVWASDVDARTESGPGSGSGSDSGTGATWTVFDPTGVARGRVQLPEGLTLFQIEEDWILGTVRDEMGVPRVVLHALHRRPES